jgi:hypothetical protein
VYPKERSLQPEAKASHFVSSEPDGKEADGNRQASREDAAGQKRKMASCAPRSGLPTLRRLACRDLAACLPFGSLATKWLILPPSAHLEVFTRARAVE